MCLEGMGVAGGSVLLEGADVAAAPGKLNVVSLCKLLVYGAACVQFEPSPGMTCTRPPGIQECTPHQYHKTWHLYNVEIVKVVTGGVP